ncbi:MAG: hypothetical protein DRN64_00070 [Thaumarchaeota archaeon]|nr:MAG: hypothetical protein DRN64_00070 [Nitrososphaerota archaeon]HDD66309.1 hypothetical protein [Nitrososphaeria archaeon]
MSKQEILDWLKELVYEIDVKKWLRLLRGLAIFIIAVLILSYVTDYILHYKIEMTFGLRGFEGLTPTTPDFGSIVAARSVQSVIMLFIIVMAILLVAMFTGRDLNLVKLLTLVFHSFIVVAVFASLQAPLALQVPRASFMIVDVSFQNVTFRNADLIGTTPKGEIRISADVVRVGYLRAFRAYPNLTLPDWSYLGVSEAEEALRNTRTYMNMSRVSWFEGGVEKISDKVDLCTGNWSDVSYDRLLGRTSIRLSEDIPLQEYLLSLFSMFSTLGLVVYNTAGFRKLYEASWKATIAVGLIMFILLMFFGSL